MFENKIFEGIHYSRFIASWTNQVGIVDYHFKDWLKSLTINGKVIPEEVIEEIYELGTNGKLELETSALIFLKNYKEEA
jgi:hypothetical protein